MAADEGWSVRTLEQRAREANESGADVEPTTVSRREPHPDQIEACASIGEALRGALGTEVRVAVGRGGAYRAELTFASPQEAFALAKRVRKGQKF